MISLYDATRALAVAQDFALQMKGEYGEPDAAFWQTQFNTMEEMRSAMYLRATEAMRPRPPSSGEVHFEVTDEGKLIQTSP